MKTEQYKCKSYYDDDNVLKDCTCGKCGDTKNHPINYTDDVNFYDDPYQKLYKIKFTSDYTEFEKWADGGDEYWKEKVKKDPGQLAMCKKYRNKKVVLKDIPKLIEEVGEIVLSGDMCEIYNDYRE